MGLKYLESVNRKGIRFCFLFFIRFRKNRLENSFGWNVQKCKVSTLNLTEKFGNGGYFKLLFRK